MNRQDLNTSYAKKLIRDLNKLIRNLYVKNLFMSAWTGNLPSEKERILKFLASKFNLKIESRPIGFDQRLNYSKLSFSEDDCRYPWFLYWEIYWMLNCLKEFLKPGMTILDAGGASSLFSCYMASIGYEVYTIDLNESLVENSNKIAKK